jgi:hypothetical protein
MDAASDLCNSFHIESHAQLIARPIRTTADRRRLDAIVVPTVRPHWLGPAAELAANVGCRLVALCSTPAQADHAVSVCRSLCSDVAVTCVPPVDHDLLFFRSALHPELDIETACHADIARKRNVGLLLARLCGWRTIMYLDDDIRDLNASEILWGADLTGNYQAVGFNISHYPDNSVVCHAHRLAGGKQDIFLGGSALMLDVVHTDTQFPPIYNEDWLFLFDIVRLGSVAVVGTLSQLEYQPFATSQRAASEEFGDLIAEGLFRLIHEGADTTDATYEYWRDAIQRRSRFVDDVADRLLRKDGDAHEIGCALMALAAARKRLSAISPLACVSFIRAWRIDVEEWRHRLDSLPLLGDFHDAAKYLGLLVADGHAAP